MTIIVYANSTDHLSASIDDIISKTPNAYNRLVICNDSGAIFKHTVRVVNTDKIGYAAAVNKVLSAKPYVKDPSFVVVRAPCKVSEGWLDALVPHDREIVSPIVHDLDIAIWKLANTVWRRTGFRWDMCVYDRLGDGTDTSPSVSPFCFAINTELFLALGGFNDGLADYYETLDLSLKCWLSGGNVRVSEQSVIGSVILPQTRHTKSAGHIMHSLLPEHLSKFYAFNSVKSTETGRFVPFSTSVDSTIVLDKIQPELGLLYEKYQSATGKSVAVMADGPSLDMMDTGFANRHDTIIAADTVAHLLDCDYVVSNNIHNVVALRDQFDACQFVLPALIHNNMVGHNISINEVMPGCLAYEPLPYNAPPNSAFPPFCNSDSAVLTAVQFALFLRPASVTVYGCDFKMLAGKSHSSVVDQWNETDAAGRFGAMENLFRKLGVIATNIGVPLFRMNHA